MTSRLLAGLASGSVDASLMEVDASTKNSDRLPNGVATVGPFSAFGMSETPIPDQSGDPAQGLENDPPIDFTPASYSDHDSLLDVRNVLGWNDLFEALTSRSLLMTSKPMRILLHSLQLLYLSQARSKMATLPTALSGWA